MAGKPQSWKKIRDGRREDNFVGRGEPINVFTKNLQSDPPDYMVISITGDHRENVLASDSARRAIEPLGSRQRIRRPAKFSHPVLDVAERTRGGNRVVEIQGRRGRVPRSSAGCHSPRVG